MNTRIRWIMVFTTSLAMSAMMASSALAQEYPPDVDFGVACTAAQAGQVVTCTVVGAAPGEELTVSAAHGTTVFFTEVLSANADGEASFSFTVPADAGGDQIVVTVSGAISGTTTDVLAVAISVPTTPGVPVTPSPAIARTGQDLMMIGAIGLVLLVGGVLAVRRRRASAEAKTTHRIDA